MQAGSPFRGTPWDVIAFTALVLAFVWLVVPTALGDGLKRFLALPLLAVPLASLRLRGHSAARAGLRLDNLARALPVYLACAVGFSAVVLLLYLDSLERPDLPVGWVWGGVRLLGWALLQQFLLLSFYLNRLREALGHDGAAVVVAAVVFALFHLPNPFLTLYTLGGGLVVGALFLRLPNLWAAALAHAGASTLAGELLPEAVTHGLRVGPGYGQLYGMLSQVSQLTILAS